MLRILRITFALTLASLAFAMPLSAADACVASCGHSTTRGIDVSVPSPAAAGDSMRASAGAGSRLTSRAGARAGRLSPAPGAPRTGGAGRSGPLRI